MKNSFDYIFINDHFEADTFQVDRIIEGEVFISDHWLVVAGINFKN